MLLLHNTPEYANALKNAYRQFPAKGSTLDIDFINNRQRVAGIYGAALDGVTFTRSTTGTYFDATGTMQTAAINEPRFDYDPVSRRPLGLLIEESRANTLVYSNDYGNAAWIKTRSSILAGVLTEDTTASSSHEMVQPIAGATNATAYTASCYVKPAGRQHIVVALAGTAIGSATSAAYTLTGAGTAAVLQGTPTARISPSSNGRYRIELTTVTTAAGSINVYLYLATSASLAGLTYTGDGTSGVSVENAQLEAGAFATSYIPTTSASVTRGADVASMTGANFNSWYNQSEGAFYILGSSTRVGTGITNYMFEVDNNNNSNLGLIGARIGAGALQSVVYDANNVVAFLNFGAQPMNTPLSIATGYAVNNIGASGNGSSILLDNLATIPNVMQLQLGRLFTSTSYLNGHIQRLVYHPKRLPNNLLQYLSTLTA